MWKLGNSAKLSNFAQLQYCVNTKQNWVGFTRLLVFRKLVQVNIYSNNTARKFNQKCFPIFYQNTHFKNSDKYSNREYWSSFFRKICCNSPFDSLHNCCFLIIRSRTVTKKRFATSPQTSIFFNVSLCVNDEVFSNYFWFIAQNSFVRLRYSNFCILVKY